MKTHPQVIQSIPELIAWRKSLHSSKKVGFVPTMGALHEGHATLMRKIRPHCDISVLSIFVNPTQFGPKEDFSKYPRTFEYDLEIAAQEKVDVVFAPTLETMYPEGYSTYVEETVISRPLCGTFRPVFFRGVTTVVLKLFNLIKPQLSYFGLKDAQQFFVIKKMVEDLHLDITLEGIPTVREQDGLALSSRNAYLNPEQRKIAPTLYQSLSKIEQSLIKRSLAGIDLPLEELNSLLSSTQQWLSDQGFQVQYLECRSLPDLKEPQDSGLTFNRDYLVAVAAFLGTTRLIDNIIFQPKRR